MSYVADCKILVPDDMYELDDEFPRIPKPGETCISENGYLMLVTEESNICGKRYILRLKYKWPEWLLARWMYRDFSGEWYATNYKPKKCGNFYNFARGAYAMRLDLPNCLPFVAPPKGCYILENPNYKECDDE